MSSARSNAAARNRRAGDPPGQPIQQGRPGQVLVGQGQGQGMRQPPQYQQQQQQQQPQQTKMSLPDAIGLITLRLGRVETVVQHLQTDLPTGDYSGGGGGGNGGGGVDLPDNMRVVDEAVFNSIVSRLNQLELEHKQLAIKTQKASTPAAAPVQLKDERFSQIKENVEILQAEIVQIKDLLLKLQSFTMETNQKLADIIFTDKQEGNDDAEQINICSDNDYVDHNKQMVNLMQFLGGGGMGMSVAGLSETGGLNLKEYIQSEMSSNEENIVVEELVEELVEE